MLRRLVPATAAAALLLAGLTACASEESAAEACSTPYAPGVLSDGVTVSGTVGERPEVKLPSDVPIKTTQRTVHAVSEGDSDQRVDEGTLVGVNLSAFDAATGTQVYESPGFDSGVPEYLIISEEQPNPLADSLRCATAGERVVMALSVEDSAPFAPQLGVTGSVVFVADVMSATKLAAKGSPKGLPSGYPAVVTDEAGQPGVVLPPRPAPAGISSAARIVGEGPVLEAEDDVIAQILDVGWDGSIAQNSWDAGPMGLAGETASGEAGVTYRAELTGYPVGSQVVVVENQGEQQRVVVVDILATI